MIHDDSSRERCYEWNNNNHERGWSAKGSVLSALVQWQELWEINFKPDTLQRSEAKLNVTWTCHSSHSLGISVVVFAACLMLVSKYFMSTFMCVYLQYCATITDFLPGMRKKRRRLLHSFISKIAAYERRVNKMILCKRANRWECSEWRLRYVFDFLQFFYLSLFGWS